MSADAAQVVREALKEWSSDLAATDAESEAAHAALDVLLGELEQTRTERDEALAVREGHVSAVQKVIELRARAEAAETALARAVYLAEHLLCMVPRDVWRDQGGDDGQGHYEGDYWAEQTAEELKGLAALVSVREQGESAQHKPLGAGGETP